MTIKASYRKMLGEPYLQPSQAVVMEMMKMRTVGISADTKKRQEGQGLPAGLTPEASEADQR